jgi:GTP pyrophosphokinase
MMRQFELAELVRSYDPHADEDAINRAYVYSIKAHGTQLRDSGDPYFSHPIEVAGILAQMKLDTASIVTGLLHDTVEDTVATLDDIERVFGAETARLVDGVTKLSRIELQSDQTQQAENFRKLVLAMSEDIRVLLVKLADRLHNMQTLRFIKSDERRRRIARETMDIYAPLAERLGMHRMKDELEDLAFAELHADARASIRARLDFLRDTGATVVPRILAELDRRLEEGGLTGAAVSGREKSPYSIWRKMQRKNVAFEQLSDVMAFRILVSDIGDCYHALGVIHSAYHVVPGRFKDYISTPKPNNYRSLHTGVIGPEQQRIEVQIRTREMHEIAELGVAAHWSYRQGAGKTEGPQYRWLRELLDILDHASGPEEFLEHTKLEMFQDQVFAFTPKGDLIALPRGATPVDFAYAVHSEIGDRASARRSTAVWCRCVAPGNDQVEIITSKAQTRRDGSGLSSPAGARPHPPFHPYPAAAPGTSISGGRSCKRRSARRARSSRAADRDDTQNFSCAPSRILRCRSARGRYWARIARAAFPLPRKPRARSRWRARRRKRLKRRRCRSAG